MADWAKMVENRDAEIERLKAGAATSAEHIRTLYVEITRLRAELTAEEAAHCNTENAAQREYDRLSAELAESKSVALSRCGQLDALEATINSVRAVLDDTLSWCHTQYQNLQRGE